MKNTDMRIAPVFLALAYVFWSSLCVHSNLVTSVNDSLLLNGIEIVNRRFLYSNNSNNKPCVSRSLGSRQFQFKGGYVSDHPDIFHLLQQYEAVRIVHYCPLISNLMNSHLRVKRSASHDCKHKTFVKSTNIPLDKGPKKSSFEISDRRVFRATKFLEQLRDKKLTFYGDSINRQIFLDLVAELNLYQTEFSYLASNKTIVVKENSTTTHHLSDLHRLFSKRVYGAYNVSILYYDDGYANRFWLNNLHNNEHAWDRELRRSDIIVVGIGAWFKPGFHPVLNNTNYYEDMRLKLEYLNSSMWRLRDTFRRHVSNAKIIWRTNAHVGMIDELPGINRWHNLSYDTSPRGHYFHSRGEVWENISFGAVWPMYFNQLYVPIAQHYGDKVLDYWQVSVQYLTWVDALVEEANRLLSIRTSQPPSTYIEDDVSARKRFHPLLNDANLLALRKFIDRHSRGNFTISTHAFYPVMSDSLHYCPGGVPRAGVFLLYDLLMELVRMQSRIATKKTLSPEKERVDADSLQSRKQKEFSFFSTDKSLHVPLVALL